jgi:hypothetical protein
MSPSFLVFQGTKLVTKYLAGRKPFISYCANAACNIAFVYPTL